MLLCRLEEEARDFKPTIDFPNLDPEVCLRVALGVTAVEKGRAAVSLFQLDSKTSTLDCLNIGDLRLVHFSLGVPSQAKLDKIEEMEKKRDVTHAEIAREKNKKSLTETGIVPQTYFNLIHSEFVGDHGVKPSKGLRRCIEVKPGDYLVLMNRGVGDSLYDHEIAAIIEKFENLPVSPPDLDAVAHVVAEKAFKKIIEFAVDRPLVDKIKKMDVNMETISVDECHCLVFQVYKD